MKSSEEKISTLNLPIWNETLLQESYTERLSYVSHQE